MKELTVRSRSSCDMSTDPPGDNAGSIYRHCHTSPCCSGKSNYLKESYLNPISPRLFLAVLMEAIYLFISRTHCRTFFAATSSWKMFTSLTTNMPAMGNVYNKHIPMEIFLDTHPERRNSQGSSWSPRPHDSPATADLNFRLCIPGRSTSSGPRCRTDHRHGSGFVSRTQYNPFLQSSAGSDNIKVP